MSNDNTPENKDLDPVVQAVVNALNDRSKFEPSYVKQNLNEMSIADRVKARGEAKAARRDAEKEEKAREWLSQRGITGAEQDAMIKKGVELHDARLKRGQEAAQKRDAMKEEVEQVDEAAKTKKEKLKALLYRDRSNVKEFGKSAGLSAAQKAAARKAIANEEVEQVEELLDDNSLVVDIYEEDGQIVGIDNGILFVDEELPGLETVEYYRGAGYIDDLINEATTQKPAAKPAPKPVAKPAPKPVAKPAPKPAGGAKPPAGKPPGGAKPPAPKPPVGGAKPPAGKPPVTGGVKPPGAAATTNTKAKPKPKPTPASMRTDAATKKEDKPSTTASGVIQRAKDTKLATGDLDLAIGDQLKATDQVVSQNIKDAAAKMKPGTVTKPSLLNRLTGGRFGKGATYTPGDASAWDDSLKDFGKKVTDAAAKIKLDRDIASKPWETKGSEPGPTDGGKDVLDQLEKDTAAVGGGADAGADEAPATGGGGTGGGATGGRRKVPINFRIAGQAGTVEREAYKKGRESGDIESQDVSFNVRNAKTGERRTIRSGDPEYAQYMSRYKKMSQAVMEALIRMGAVLTEEGWMIDEQLLESIYTEYAPVEMESPYYYDSTGRLRIMSESEWSTLGLADVILQRLIQEAMDEVGKEDEDVDNDGDSDSSDDYLKNRREKIAAKMKEKLDEQQAKIYPDPRDGVPTFTVYGRRPKGESRSMRDLTLREVPGAVRKGIDNAARRIGDVTLGQIGDAVMATPPGMVVKGAMVAKEKIEQAMARAERNKKRPAPLPPTPPPTPMPDVQPGAKTRPMPQTKRPEKHMPHPTWTASRAPAPAARAPGSVQFTEHNTNGNVDQIAESKTFPWRK